MVEKAQPLGIRIRINIRSVWEKLATQMELNVCDKF